MTPAAQLQSTIELLTAVDTTERPADAVLAAFFRARRFIGAKDRGVIAGRTYAILRAWHRLSWWHERAKMAPSARSTALAYLILNEGMRADAAAGLFAGQRHAPQPLADGERKLAKFLDRHTLDHPEMPEATRGECPSWAYPGLRDALAKKFAEEMRASLSEAPLDLRVNVLKTTREEAQARLAADGFMAEATKLSPWGLRLSARGPLMAHPLYKNGAIEIQDEGSQLVALAMGVRPSMRVVDFCAGAGGKTLALAAMMKNKGRIVACDTLSGRLKRGALRFRRAGVDTISVQPIASERDPWVKRHKESFDRVLVDAPCTGTGTWRRNPDARFRTLGPGLSALLPLQAAILGSAQRLVKPGGRLVYATCSLLPEENARQIQAFLAAHSDFRVVPLSQVYEEGGHGTPPCADPYLQLTPAQHGTDGFFAAVLEKAASGAKTEKPK